MLPKYTAWPKESHRQKVTCSKISPLAWITAGICGAIVSISFRNVKFISIQYFIIFLQDLALMTVECDCWAKPSPAHPKYSQWVKVRTDGCITSSASLLTLMHLSPWNRVNLDSSDHTTFFHCFGVQSLCSPTNGCPFFKSTSPIRVFWGYTAGQLPITRAPFALEMRFLYWINLALSPTAVFLILMERLRDC